MMQKLSKRLLAAAEFVTPGSRAADIGTDHGFLPIYLVQRGICQSTLAMDIREGPLQRAKEHIAAAGLQRQIRTRLSNGMKELAPGEADSVVIAGMGGLTILKILKGGNGPLLGIKELILEPQSDLGKVRRFLRESGLCIDREALILEDGKFYPVLHAVTGEWKTGGPEQRMRTLFWESRTMQDLKALFQNSPADEEQLLRLADQYGACLICSGHPVLKQLIGREEARCRKILKSLESGGGNDIENNIKSDIEKKKKMQEHKKRRLEVERKLDDISLLQKVMAGYSG